MKTQSKPADSFNYTYMPMSHLQARWLSERDLSGHHNLNARCFYLS